MMMAILVVIAAFSVGKDVAVVLGHTQKTEGRVMRINL